MKSLALETADGSPPPTLVIAEVAQAHDGSLGTAHAFIDAIARADADGVKFQTHIAAAESTPAEPWRVKFSRQDATRYDYWKRMEFSEEQWSGLRSHAEDCGLLFLSSPFSLEAVDLLTKVGVAAWKVASGEVGSEPMLSRMAATGLPVLLSTGMSPIEEVDRAVSLVRGAGAPLAVLQCTTAYPTQPEQVGINLLSYFRDRYRCPVGLSDHSGTIYPALAAVTLGASLIEVHVTLSREMFGPDVIASITTAELRQLSDGVRYIDRMMRSPVEKDESARETAPLRALFAKSIVARVDLPAGTMLLEEHLALKKPGTGLPATRVADVLNRRLTRPLPAGALLSEGDLE